MYMHEIPLIKLQIPRKKIHIAHHRTPNGIHVSILSHVSWDTQVANRPYTDFVHEIQV